MNLPVAATALPIGIAFGFILERAGLGDPRIIAAQFTGKNFAVVRVMFGAIITAMLGIALLNAGGFVNTELIAMPPTNIAAQIIGAVLFGGGFALASLCPGTACVAAASGKREGIVAVVGLFLGTALTALMWPLVDDVMNAGLREAARLPEDLGVSMGFVVFTITALGLGAMSIGREFNPLGSRRWNHLSAPEWIAISAATCIWLTQSRPQQSLPRLAAIATDISREADHVDPLDLAEWIKDGKAGLRIIDVRENVDTGTYVIPGARVLAFDSVPYLKIAPKDLVVLYSDGGTHAAQAWVLLRARGTPNVRVLKDGMAAWEDEVLRPVAPPVGSRARMLSLWFGGHPRASDQSDMPNTESTQSVAQAGMIPAKPKTIVRRRNTC